MNKAIISFAIVIALIVGIAAWKHLPQSASYYGVACLNALTYRGGVATFGRVPLDQVTLDSSGVAHYKNENDDVVAKLICAQGYQPEDYAGFYEDAVHSPYYFEISQGKVNYELVLIR